MSATENEWSRKSGAGEASRATIPRCHWRSSTAWRMHSPVSMAWQMCGCASASTSEMFSSRRESGSAIIFGFLTAAGSDMLRARLGMDSRGDCT